MTTYISKNDLEYTVDFGTNDDMLELSALFDFASEGLVKYYHDDLYAEDTDFTTSIGVVEFSKYFSTDDSIRVNYPYTVDFDTTTLVPDSDSVLVGTGTKWWTGARPVSVSGEPYPDKDIDVGAVQSTHSIYHPKNL